MFEENRVSTLKFSKLFDKWLVKINSLYTEASVVRNLIGRIVGALNKQFDWSNALNWAIWLAN